MTTQISKINRIRRILYEIAGAVVYLHERGIVHRDIKPDNVFVSHVRKIIYRIHTNLEILEVQPLWGAWSMLELSIMLPQRYLFRLLTIKKWIFGLLAASLMN